MIAAATEYAYRRLTNVFANQDGKEKVAKSRIVLVVETAVTTEFAMVGTTILRFVSPAMRRILAKGAKDDA